MCLIFSICEGNAWLMCCRAANDLPSSPGDTAALSTAAPSSAQNELDLGGGRYKSGPDKAPKQPAGQSKWLLGQLGARLSMNLSDALQRLSIGSMLGQHKASAQMHIPASSLEAPLHTAALLAGNYQNPATPSIPCATAEVQASEEVGNSPGSLGQTQTSLSKAVSRTSGAALREGEEVPFDGAATSCNVHPDLGMRWARLESCAWDEDPGEQATQPVQDRCKYSLAMPSAPGQSALSECYSLSYKIFNAWHCACQENQTGATYIDGRAVLAFTGSLPSATHAFSW